MPVTEDECIGYVLKHGSHGFMPDKFVSILMRLDELYLQKLMEKRQREIDIKKK